RTQALAAGADDVAADLLDQWDAGVQLAHDQLVDSFEIVGNRSIKRQGGHLLHTFGMDARHARRRLAYCQGTLLPARRCSAGFEALLALLFIQLVGRIPGPENPIYSIPVLTMAST